MTEKDTGPEDFQDPLENYEPPQYSDPLEEALVENEVGTIRHLPFTTISPETTVQDAVRQLAGLHIACLLVAENDTLLGVFSDRDVLSKIAFEFDELKDHPVREVMSTAPVYVHETDSAVASLSVMAMCGYRHVPVLDVDDKLVGIVSPQRVTDFLQHHFKQGL